MTLGPIHELFYDLFRAAEEGIAARLGARGWPRLGRAQMSAVRCLSDEETTVAALARGLAVTRQAAHQTVKQLDGLNLISRHGEENDDGVKWITLSDEGRRLVRDLTDAIEETERALEEHLGGGRMWALRKVFDHLAGIEIDLRPH